MWMGNVGFYIKTVLMLLMMSSVSSNYFKDEYGNVYWPAFGLNSIGICVQVQFSNKMTEE